MAQANPLLSFDHVTKDFYENVVLQDVCFELERGQILGLVGENGAGKTTLMRILFGMPVIAETGGFQGRVCIEGEEVRFASPFDALEAGIGMVHQEFSLIPGFTTTENILLNREPMKATLLNAVFGDRLSVLDRPAMRRKAEACHRPAGGEAGPGHPGRGNARRPQAVHRDRPRDQPGEDQDPRPGRAHGGAHRDRSRGAPAGPAPPGRAGYRHHLHLPPPARGAAGGRPRRGPAGRQDGQGHPAAGVSVRDVASWMVGREMAAERARSRGQRRSDAELLTVEHLWVDMPGETVRDVSFTVREGEIFGIGGLAGQGKLGIPNGIMGLFPAGGTIRLHGQAVPLDSPREVLQLGMAFVSEDRRGVGLLLDEGLDWNLAFTAMQIRGQYLRPLLWGLLKLRDERGMNQLTEEYVGMLDIKCQSPRQKAKELSGGNQQKVCLARAFAVKPRLLFVSEPTRGIDVGAKKLVLDALLRYNREYGTTIVMVSSELEELRSICDRIAIVDEGRIAGILAPDAELSEFGLLMAGERVEARGA